MTKLMDTEVSNEQYITITNILCNTYGKLWHDFSFDKRRVIVKQLLNE